MLGKKTKTSPEPKDNDRYGIREKYNIGHGMYEEVNGEKKIIIVYGKENAEKKAKALGGIAVKL